MCSRPVSRLLRARLAANKKDWKRLQAPEFATVTAKRRTLAARQRYLALFNAKYNHIAPLICTAVFGIGLLVLIFPIYQTIVATMPQTTTFLGHTLYLSLSMIIAMILFVLLATLSMTIVKSLQASLFWIFMPLMAMPAVGWGMAQILRPWMEIENGLGIGYGRSLLYALSVAFAGISTCFIVVMLCAFAVNTLAVVWRRRRFAEDVVITNLVSCLADLARGDVAWSVAEHRKKVTARLIECAHSTAAGMPAMSRGLDARHSEWSKQQFRLRSEYFRELAKWPVTPGPSTRLDLIDRVEPIPKPFLGWRVC